MELWLYLALASAVFGGVNAFTFKIAATKNANFNVLNIYASTLSASLLALCTLYFSNFDYFWTLATVVAALGAAMYLLTAVYKVEALKVIDSGIFFPLYKVAGPTFAIVVGLIIFGESFSTKEWAGLLLSLFIPLLLITKSEKSRQKDLRRGVQYVLVAAAVGVVSISLFKYGTDIAKNIWLFLLVSDVFLAVASIITLVHKYQNNALAFVRANSPRDILGLVLLMGVSQAIGAATMVFAFAEGGALSIVYTINSLYILVPIILSVLIYKEHISIQKTLAIILSVVVLALFK